MLSTDCFIFSRRIQVISYNAFAVHIVKPNVFVGVKRFDYFPTFNAFLVSIFLHSFRIQSQTPADFLLFFYKKKTEKKTIKDAIFQLFLFLPICDDAGNFHLQTF